MRKILLLVDLNKLWAGSATEFGKNARINFSSIIEKSQVSKKDLVIPYAFITTTEGANFTRVKKKLEENGFEVHLTEKSCFKDIFLELIEQSQGVADMVVLLAFDKKYGNILTTAKNLGMDTVLLSFSKVLDKELANAADNIKLFTRKDVVFV